MELVLRPVLLTYEWLETPGHPASDKKPFMIGKRIVYFAWLVKTYVPHNVSRYFRKDSIREAKNQSRSVYASNQYYVCIS